MDSEKKLRFDHDGVFRFCMSLWRISAQQIAKGISVKAAERVLDSPLFHNFCGSEGVEPVQFREQILLRARRGDRIRSGQLEDPLDNELRKAEGRAMARLSIEERDFIIRLNAEGVLPSDICSQFAEKFDRELKPHTIHYLRTREKKRGRFPQSQEPVNGSGPLSDALRALRDRLVKVDEERAKLQEAIKVLEKLVAEKVPEAE